MANSKRKCKFCKEYFPASEAVKVPAGVFCSLDHAIQFANQKQQSEKRKQWSKDKREYRKSDKSIRAKAAQAAFNAYIRQRDALEPCISCGRFHPGQWHAGHYRSVGAAPELRFEELNCHKQCAPCNNHLSGNIAEYRINLIKKIGLSKVEWIEGKHEAKHYTAEMLLKIEKEYKEKLKSFTN